MAARDIEIKTKKCGVWDGGQYQQRREWLLMKYLLPDGPLYNWDAGGRKSAVFTIKNISVELNRKLLENDRLPFVGLKWYNLTWVVIITDNLRKCIIYNLSTETQLEMVESYVIWKKLWFLPIICIIVIILWLYK